MYTMQDLCPLCLKNGIKKKTKLLQINLHEAIFVCEEAKCAWPFGCEDFIFYSRPVGRIWSCYWDDQKPIPSKLRENVIFTKPEPDNLNLDDFTTTSFNAPNDYSKNTEINSNTNSLKTNNQLINSTYKNPDISCNDQHQQIKPVNICTNINNRNVQVTTGNTTDAEAGNENINLSDKHVKEKRDLCVQNSQSINNVKGTAKITNINKTNISIPNVTTGHYTCVNHDSKEKIVCISKLGDNVEYKLTSVSSDEQFPKYLPKCEKLTNSTSSENELSNSSLIPIASDETTAYPSTRKATTPNTQQIENKNIVGGGVSNDAKLSTLVDNASVMMPSVARGKRYQKFSFSAIKKKMESQNASDTNSNNVNSLGVKPDLRTQDVENNLQNSVKKETPTENRNNNEKVETCNIDYKQLAPHEATSHLPNGIDHSETVNNLLDQENVSADISANTSLNIDTVLEDLITNDYVSKDINDEWIDSLLT